MQLSELRDRVLMLPSLEKRQELLSDEIKNAEDEVSKLLQQYERESRDVENIQKESLSSFLLKLVGKYEDKLETEQREEISAKLVYDRAAIRLDSLKRDRDDLCSRIQVLRGDERDYQAELAKRRAELGTRPSGQGIQYDELEIERKATVSQITEINEALRAADRAKLTANQARESLKSAEGWATYDAFTRGGLISHIAKYSHIDNAEQSFHTLSARLRDLKTELNDVQGLNVSGLTEISSGQRMVDFWFDNIFTDLSVRGQIKDNAEEVRRLIGNLNSCESALKARAREAEAKLAEIKGREEEFLISL